MMNFLEILEECVLYLFFEQSVCSIWMEEIIACFQERINWIQEGESFDFWISSDETHFFYGYETHKFDVIYVYHYQLLPVRCTLL